MLAPVPIGSDRIHSLNLFGYLLSWYFKMEMETERMATCYKIDRGFVEDTGREERANAGFELNLDHFILYLTD